MMPVEFDVTGKVVFITGAGRGIGKGIAQVLAEAGADVALDALTPNYVADTAAQIAAATGRRVVPIIADVTKADEVQRAVDQVLATFGRIDVLVNALGDSIRKPLVALPGNEDAGTGVSDDELRFIMDINLTEALLCTRAVGPHMLARRSGKVINIASWTAHQGGRDMVLHDRQDGAGRVHPGAGARMGALRRARQRHIARPVSGCGDGRRGTLPAEHAARRADRAAPAAWAAAGGRAAGAVPGVGCVGLHDRANHTARRRAGFVAASGTRVSSPSATR
jgi:NAD(P)-dependent dehydrogenase (short-subunit alcohol dehydrogenase family)